MGETAFSRALTEAEDRLRARGMTGAQAFDALLPALEERLGLGQRAEVPTAVREVAAALPLPAPGEADLLGLAYERFFPDLFKGLRGQFFTPPPVGRLLVAGLRLGAGQTVLDPTAGSGGLLVLAARAGASVRGIEIDGRLARLAALNLKLAGIEPEVRRADFFATEPGPVVDAIVANPPFSVDVTDEAVLGRYEAGRGRACVASDRLFVEAIERWVGPGGRAGVVMPMSLLANPSWQDVRERIDAHWVRERICTLPEGVFRPFGGAAGRAVLLWLVRRPALEVRTGWAELEDPGYDVRTQRIRRTSEDQIEALCRGEGFVPLDDAAAWVPSRRSGGRSVRSLARQRRGRAGSGPVAIADLGHADRATGELHPEAAGEVGPRVAMLRGDVAVAQLRPNLGNVVRVPDSALPVAGSPEWIVLEPIRCGGWLLHALRTPAWRGALPLLHGQTRPRISVEAVLDSGVAWPGEALAERVGALSERIFAERARLRSALCALQSAVDRYAAGEIDERALGAEVATLEADLGSA